MVLGSVPLMQWIDALTPATAQFLGAVIGGGGGLVANLTGALVNAASIAAGTTDYGIRKGGQ